ncbi:MAG: protein kinase [Acidobacteriota bacterium]
MSTDPDPDLLRLAEAVSDVKSVDWEEASGAHPALAATLEGLQGLEAVAEAFRSASTEAAKSGLDRLPVWGRLQVLKLIGRGAFGEVYRARDPLLDREVALKLRVPTFDDDEASNRRALDEGRRLARVRHPNVLIVHGADIDRGRVGIWTELVDGPNMREIVAERGALDPEEAVVSAVALCRALKAVHGADLVHGDVKASNVFRGADGRIVLGDFGAASELDSSGFLSGSPVSLSPERLRGAAAEPSCDLYSLGVLLYFLLSARYPVEGEDIGAILERHEGLGPVPLGERRSGLPACLTDLVDRAVATNPALRFSTAAEFENALEKLSVGGAEMRRHSKAAERKIERRSLGTWSGILAVAAMVVVAVVFFGRTFLSPAATQPLVADARLVLDAAEGPVVLEDGAVISPGDRLFLEIEARAPVHVYVANEDETGAIFTLFPVPGLDLGNPIPAGLHRLPGAIDGAVNDWQVTSAGGIETFLVMAAPGPVAELEQRLAAWTSASSDREVSYSQDSGPTLRGVGSLTAALPAANEGARLAELQQELSDFASKDGALWSQRFVLRSVDEP